MNKKQLQQINKILSDSRKQIRLQNKHLQKHMVEQNELALYKMLEYVKDQTNFLKTYLSDLRNIEQTEFSMVVLDAMQDVIIKARQRCTEIRRAYEDAKHELKVDDNLEELDFIVFHSTELNEVIHGLDRLEKVLLAYPNNQP